MNKKFILTITLALTLCMSFFSSCYAPNPLYGKWADNNGNTITFNPDLTYSATISVKGISKTYSGDYASIENVMVFTREDGSINTEWDIRGSIMYLTWTDSNGQSEHLSPYHIAK